MQRKNKRAWAVLMLLLVLISGTKLATADEPARIGISTKCDSLNFATDQSLEVNPGATAYDVLNDYLKENILWEDGQVTGLCCAAFSDDDSNNDKWILNGDFQQGSSWVLILNGQILSEQAATYNLYSGDQLCLEFSLTGDGYDLDVAQKVAGDTTMLNNLITDLQARDNFSLYLQDQNFSNVFNQAQELIQSGYASQDDIDQLLVQLTEAIPAIIRQISFEQKDLSLLVNESYTPPITMLADNVVDNNDVVWTSSDESLLAVDGNGVVTAKSSGTVFLTASARIGQALDVCQVTITAIPLEKISLSLSELCLEPGGQYQIGISFYPENTTDEKLVTWQSSDEGVAQVSEDGQIQALANGIATLTATTGSGHLALCQVKVDWPVNLAAAIENRMNTLPEVALLTLQDELLLADVCQEYQSVSPETKALVSEQAAQKLNDLTNRMAQLKSNQQIAEAFMQVVMELPDISELALRDESAIKSLIDQYKNGLTIEQKDLVSQTSLEKLDNSLLQINQVKKNNQQQANRVMGLIADLPLQAELETAEEVASVRTEYDLLSDDQKALVENIPSLEMLEKNLLDEIKNAIKDTDLEACLSSEKSMDDFILVAKAFDQLTDSEKEKLDPLLIARLKELQNSIKAEDSSGLVFALPFNIKAETDQLIVTDDMLAAVNQKLTEQGKEEAQYLQLYQISFSDLYQYGEMVELTEPVKVSIALNKEASADLQYFGIAVSEEGGISVYENTQELEEAISFEVVNPLYIGIIGISPVIQTAAIRVDEKINTEVEQAYDATAAYMMVAAAQPTIQSGLWESVCFARSGYAVPEGYYDTFYNNVMAEVAEGGGSISGDRTNTDYSKTIIALTAIGKDPTNVGGYNLLAKLSNFEKIQKGGMMAYVWALIALDTRDYQIPVTDSGTQTTRDLLIQTILDREVVAADGTRGGFSLYYNSADATPDTDVTAMTLQALAKYKDREDVKVVIDRALSVLSGLQNDNGSYGTFGAPETSESTSQVILALTSLGIDPAEDARFIKGDNWLLSDLMAYYVDGGGFMHIKAGGESNGGAQPGAVNGMASYQASQAIIAYQRFLAGKTWVFDITDGFSPVINNQISMDDLKDRYDNAYNKSSSAVSAGGSSAGGSAGGGTVAATSAGGGVVKAADTSSAPWSFEGEMLSVQGLDEESNSESEIFAEENRAAMIGGGLVILLAAAGAIIVFLKKKTGRTVGS
ncbi:Ig-like domain-containing protein [Eubacteriaceae bacterium ES2]|nr:Ig-like domain-containing protein [Eubacteriaceae bacterium ES2]